LPVASSPAPASAAPPLPNTYWVLPGKILAGEYPGGASAELTRARLAKLLESGITSFIDLTQPRECAPYDALLPVGVDYLRRPIADHGLPSAPSHVAELLAYVRDALHEGKVIYLHCRAGIGRTGTLVGCLLAEQGLSGEDALSELNRLWQQSARSAKWPTIPETDEQTEYVRQWQRATPAQGDPLFEPATLAAARLLRERFQGALLGLAVGDAVAVATQFGKPGRFTAVGDMLGGGPFDLPRGGWSDDTAMALCIAESLIECERFDVADQVMRYRRWQQEGYLSATGQCLGITAGTARALALAHWRRQPYSGAHDPQSQEADALSRVTPVAMYFFSQTHSAANWAAEAARTTCQAPMVLEACRALAEVLHAALCGKPKATIIARARTAAAVRGAPGAPLPEGAPADLAAALDVFARTDNFRDAVLAAANLGGNSDVVAAACGALAGAHYSASAIPALWRNSLMKKQLIEGTADKLLAHAMLGLGS
jgi:ADP-ribosylglycohydrolase